MSCGEFYNPREANDSRFDAFPDLKINFVSGINGWSWRAVNQAHYEAFADGFLSLDLAIENCLETLSGTPEMTLSMARKPIGEPTGDLAKYLKKWDKKFS